MGPFTFMTSVESVQLTGVKAASLAELDEGLQRVEDSAIYHHTHRFYRAHSFLGSSDRSDFALWVSQNLREAVVAEQMGALDLRDYATIHNLREALRGTLGSLRDEPERWTRRVPPGLEFHFCGSTSLVFYAGYTAHNLEQFLQALERVDVACIYHHLIEAPLHFHGSARAFSNDFSQWLSDLGFGEQATALAQIDPYQEDLETVRNKILDVFRKNQLRSTLLRSVQRIARNPAGEAAASWLKRWRKAD